MKDKYFLPEYYVEKIKSRRLLFFLLGIIPRFFIFIKYMLVRKLLRHKKVLVGDGTIVPLSLALKMNNNICIGSHSIINPIKITSFTRKIEIGSSVIIGAGVKIIMGSHNINSNRWENIRKTDGLSIDDYVWLCPDSVISPSCSHIGYGAVIAPNSVVVKDVPAMSIVGGNPARIIGQRTCVHDNIVIESLRAADLLQYLYARKV